MKHFDMELHKTPAGEEPSEFCEQLKKRMQKLLEEQIDESVGDSKQLTLSLIVSNGLYYYIKQNYEEVIKRFEKAEFLVD